MASLLRMLALAAATATSLLLISAGVAIAQNSCTGLKSLCENACWQRMGLAQLECTNYCRAQFESCIKTGVFKTRAKEYSGVQKN
jgi:hypothetical protein